MLEAWVGAGLLTSGHRSRCACSTSSRVTYGSGGNGCALHQFRSSWWCQHGTACPCSACSAACTYCWQSRSSSAYAAPSCTASCAWREASVYSSSRELRASKLTPRLRLVCWSPTRSTTFPRLRPLCSSRKAACASRTRSKACSGSPWSEPASARSASTPRTRNWNQSGSAGTSAAMSSTSHRTPDTRARSTLHMPRLPISSKAPPSPSIAAERLMKSSDRLLSTAWKRRPRWTRAIPDALANASRELVVMRTPSCRKARCL